MQLAEAVAIVHQKFVAESRDDTEDPSVEQYAQAVARCPAMMEVATQIVAARIIAHDMANRQQAADQREAELRQSQQQQQ